MRGATGLALLLAALGAAVPAAAETDTPPDDDGWDVVVQDDDTPPATPTADAQAVSPPATAPRADADEDFSLASDYLQCKGYFETQSTVFQLPRQQTAPQASGWKVLTYNRLRVDLRARPQRGFSVDADVIVRTFHGSTTYDLRDLLADELGGELQLLANSDPFLARYQLQDEIFLDNAYLTANAGPVRLQVGKQQIRFGSGYTWNPTDPFNVKDILDPTYELTGITAMRLMLFLPHEILLEAYALPHDRVQPFHAESMAAALRARIAFGRWVVATTYAYFRDPVGIHPLKLELVDARRNLIGLEVTGEVAGIGVWGEGAFNLLNRKASPGLQPFGQPSCSDAVDTICWVEALGGLSYTFEGGLVVQAEYLFNGRGSRSSDAYALWDWLAYLEQTTRYLGRHYATGMLQMPVDSMHLTLSATAVANLSDGSILLSPWLQWDWSQYLAVMVYGGLTWSDDDTDELAVGGQAGYVRLRFSF